MHLLEINIRGLGGVAGDLSLSFDRHMNLICGPNGIGKSTILDAIAQCFNSGQHSGLKKNARVEHSEITARFNRDGEDFIASYQIRSFRPTEHDTPYSAPPDAVREVLLFRVQRTFDHQDVASISRDPEKNDFHLHLEVRNGVPITDAKNWLLNRHLYSGVPDALTEVQRRNLEIAKKCFSILDPGFAFAGVEARANEIMVQSPTGKIYYEYLSSGFKACLSIMISIIKEIEYRFPNVDIGASDFNGIILIDELEIHLHPVWQTRIASVLTELFPRCQFITTTHSPHVIQSADRQQIIVLERRDDGNVYQREIPTSPHGFKHWTLDEVLTDVMGMEDTRSEQFISLMNKFNVAVDIEDYDEAARICEIFEGSLHPNNHLRKLLKLQLAEIAHVK